MINFPEEAVPLFQICCKAFILKIFGIFTHARSFLTRMSIGVTKGAREANAPPIFFLHAISFCLAMELKKPNKIIAKSGGEEYMYIEG